jgi:protein subunit release factor A
MTHLETKMTPSFESEDMQETNKNQALAKLEAHKQEIEKLQKQM